MAEKVMQCGRCETVYDAEGVTYNVGDECNEYGRGGDMDDVPCSGLLVEIITPDEEAKSKRKTNPLRWLAKDGEACAYAGPEFFSQPKAEAWLEEHGRAEWKHDLVRITVRDAVVEETVQRKLVYGNGS